MPPIIDGGTGLAFYLEGSSQKDKWQLVLHRDVFPRIELRTFVGEGRKLRRGGMERLVQAGAANLFQSSRLYGSAWDTYLWLKMSSLQQQRIHPIAPNGDLTAAVRFREICHDVWGKAHPDKIDPRWFSTWGWRTRRFVRSYDALLLESVEAGALEQTLVQMGLNLAVWFPELSQRGLST